MYANWTAGAVLVVDMRRADLLKGGIAEEIQKKNQTIDK
jgi:hypothetical protein